VTDNLTECGVTLLKIFPFERMIGGGPKVTTTRAARHGLDNVESRGRSKARQCPLR